MEAAEKIQKLLSSMDIEEVAKAARCSTRTVLNSIKTGRLKAYRPNNKWIFYPDDVQKWIIGDEHVEKES